ncbi:deoxyribodipyrimidine photo-lyase [Pararhodobacter sp. SW119]|uniref:cryptochrome/photolyase family protein n=1 Tax=Pararhodobacter sp. SW119 TaxID=2780075 RepID=UPI001AE02997|nr:deoxyribodipyrimidine photo-lyase [Pararhodobacter sp. SW119]
MQPLILWFRRDLRLDDNPMLSAAAETGRPLIPVFIADDSVTGLGAAPRWRLGQGLEVFGKTLADHGSRLILRRGNALEVLRDLVRDTDAAGVWWGRLYDAPARARDTEVKQALRAAGTEAQSFAGHTLIEPWQVATGEGGHYKVYTPFWKALSARGVAAPCKAPSKLQAPDSWPTSDSLADWGLGAAMNRGAAIVARHARVGSAEAEAKLDAFLDGAVEDYRTARDFPAGETTSRLSENLTLGEIGPRRVWWRTQRLLEQDRGHKGAEHFLKELAWRDFAHHLVFHTPEITSGNWRPEWDAFPWRDDNADAERWRRGLTGEPFVDAGMREMYVTGTMHNRARMIVASYLTKHLMTHWKVGLKWFEDCLIDWDPASNAMGWQWVAGSGPDAAPYFRVFNPATQGEKFDPDCTWRHRFIAELARNPGADARAYFDAVPRSWKLSPDAPYPEPLVDLAEGRNRALAAYERHRGK